MFEINCLIVDDELIAREILASHLSRIKRVRLLDSCKNALDAFNVISTKKVDLIFLDINMPEISGLSFAKSINKNIKIIFTTAYREYAIDGFDLQAVDYLLKPISFERLLQSVNKYLGENVQNIQKEPTEFESDKNDFFFVRSERKMIKVNFNEISYIESIKDYIKIMLDNKAVITRETISNIEAMLPQKGFIRTHRSYIVSFEKIKAYTAECVEIGDKEIPVSRNFKDEVLKKLGSNQ